MLALLQDIVLRTKGQDAPPSVRITGAPAVLIIVGVFAAIVGFIVRYVLVQRRARVAQRERELAVAQLSALFGAMEDVVMVLDREGRVLRVPETRALALHRPTAELVGRNVAEMYPPDVVGQFRKLTVRAVDTGNTITAEFSAPFGGDVVWFAATVSPFDDRSALWVARDVTEQKRARDAIAQSEARYRLLFENNPCPMWVYEYDTTAILEVNDAAIAQYGFTRDEFAMMTLQDLREPEERPRLSEMLRTVRLDAEGVHLARHRRKDGTPMDVEVRGRPLSIPGRSLRIVVANDVTERLVAERAERQAEARATSTSELLQTLIDVAPQAMVVVDRELRVTRWNHAAEQLFGWTAAEVMGRVAPIVPEDQADNVRDRRSAIDQGQLGKPAEVVRVRKDGQRIHALCAAAPLLDRNGTVVRYIDVYTDLTERRLLEEQLRQSQKMEAIGTLAGGIAHDFNNILTVITSYSDMLLEHADTDRADLEEISTAAKRATALTRQLLTFSRKAIVHLQPVRVNEIVGGMEAMLRRLLMSHIELAMTLADDVGLVIADPSQLEQVVMNLAVNASDAMPDGGTLIIETKAVQLDEVYAQAHSGVKPGNYVMIAVTDTGIGMDAETVSKIFDPFFTTKPVGRGTGLGLATVYATVKQLGGHIWVYSEPGHGAVFKIYLSHDTARESAAGVPPARHDATRTGTVLLVEDEESVRRAVRRMLEKLGYSVLEADDGQTGLATAVGHAGPIDVVVTDLMMPRMSGSEFANALAATHPGLRVVFTSGYTDDAVLRRGLLKSGHSFLQKPFTIEQLASTISALLDDAPHQTVPLAEH